MSLRPNFYGVDIEGFKKLVSSKNQETLDKLQENYDKGLVVVDEGDGKGYQKKFDISEEEDHKAIKELFFGSIEDAKRLEKENPYILIDLITSMPGTYVTDSNLWRSYFLDYFDQVQSKVDSKAAKLIEYLNYGRSIFTGEDTTTEYPYGYLTHEEVQELLEAINKTPKDFQDTEGFGKDFKRWLEEVSKLNKDLFLIQS